jgi:nucleoside-diphosphate-sugar epimerase
VNALVTGGTGFVGGHLIDALRAAGARVTALVRSPEKAARLASLGVQLVPGDLNDPAALAEAVAEQDVIYHSAGLVAARDEAGFLAVNRDGTARIVAAAERTGRRPRFVLISSLAAAGPVARGARRLGDEPPDPRTAYGRSKLAGEAVVRAAELPWTILRPPAVYGPRDAEFLRLFKAVRWRVVPVFGDGGQELSLVYVRDLAEALIAAGASPATTGKLYYPCHREVLTSTGLARAIGQAMGRQVRTIRLPRWVAGSALGVSSAAARLTGGTTLLTPDKANEFFAPAWTADPDALTSATGWRAKHSAAEGLAATLVWYREAGWL